MRRENISNCQEKWSKMTPVEGGRFCDKCEKKVYDFTGMNKDEIIELQWQNKYSLCGIYSEKSFESKPSKTGLPKFNFKPALATGALIAGLAQSPLLAQEAEKPVLEITEEYIKLKDDRQTDVKQRLIKGKVVDKETGETLIGASVILKGTQQSTYTDFDGNFEFKYKYSGNIQSSTDTVEISYVGYKTLIIPICKMIVSSNIQELEVSACVMEPVVITAERLIQEHTHTVGVAYETHYSFEKPPLHKRIWWKIKNVFR